MITTRREANYTNDTNTARARLGLIEQPIPKAYNEVADNSETFTRNEETDKKRMSENFDILLNYEKYLADAKKKEQEEKLRAATVETEAVVVDEIGTAAPVKEDITPTSTTMQFGTDDVGSLYSDMKKDEKQDSKYRLNSHGKIMLAIYTLVVATILTLIIINTSVLASLRTANASKVNELELLNSQYTQLTDEFNQISSDQHVIEIAEGEYNMVK